MDRAQEQAFEALVATRTPALLRTAFLLTGDRQLAEDLLQVGLARTFARWGSLRSVDAGEAYVRRVLVTQHVSWRRRLWHREHPTETLPEALVDGDISAADRRDVLRRALADLPRQQRAVVVLRFYEDLTEHEVAAMLGIAVGTVKSRTHRALAALRCHGLALTPEEIS